MRSAIVVAAAENGAIGKDNRLLWHLPDDLKRFKSLTLGKPIVMGRKTFESIGKPLPGRTNIVISRQDHLALPGCVVVDSLPAALNFAQSQQPMSALPEATEAMIIGGAEIYRQSLPFANIVHRTRVHASADGDVFFPELSPTEWRETSRERHSADERHAHAFSFMTFERR